MKYSVYNILHSLIVYLNIVQDVELIAECSLQHMIHTYSAFGKCSTCSMLHSLHECEISSKFSNLLHFTNKITHLRIHRTENAMRNYHNYAFSRATRVILGNFMFFIYFSKMNFVFLYPKNQAKVENLELFQGLQHLCTF